MDLGTVLRREGCGGHRKVTGTEHQTKHPKHKEPTCKSDRPNFTSSHNQPTCNFKNQQAGLYEVQESQRKQSAHP